MSNIIPNFSNSYDNLPIVTIPLSVINYTGSNTVSCFCGDIDTVVCYPVFDNLPAQLNFIENWGYYIDMGDGTIVNELTAFHNYKVPGTYNITLVVTDSASNFYKSANVYKIEAYNLIPDNINMICSINEDLTIVDGWGSLIVDSNENSILVVDGIPGNTVKSSSVYTPITLYRYNSFQIHNILSSVGYNINISVSGNQSRKITPQTYNSSQYVHLCSYSTFLDMQTLSQISSIKTTSDNIYAQVNPLTNKIEILNSNSTGIPGVPTFFVGTSGYAKFYYYEDII